MSERAAARWAGFAAELSRNSHAVQVLLDRHRRTPQGTCTECTTGGRGSQVTPWPCAPYALAERARAAAAAAATAAASAGAVSRALDRGDVDADPPAGTERRGA